MLNGRAVIVTGGGRGIGRDIALGLSGMRAEVSVVDGPIESRADATRAFPAKTDAVVHALVDPDALHLAPLAETDAPDWRRRSEDILCTALWCAQAAYGALADGGHLVFITPTIGLTGAAGLVPYATAVEGVRSLAKCAARQWRDREITVNCVAPPVELVGPAGQGAPVAQVVGMLLAGPVTGATVVVDGGVVMAP